MKLLTYTFRHKDAGTTVVVHGEDLFWAHSELARAMGANPRASTGAPSVVFPEVEVTFNVDDWHLLSAEMSNADN